MKVLPPAPPHFIVRLNMGFFSRTPRPNPKITVEGIEIEFDRRLPYVASKPDGLPLGLRRRRV
jgi:hypothetical protein